MSTLKVNNIQTASGGSNSTPEQIEQGRTKLWVNWNGTGTVAIRDSFNVSSITDEGTGSYTVNFSTNMSNTDYCPNGMCSQTGTNVGNFDAVTFFNFNVANVRMHTFGNPIEPGSETDCVICCTNIFGDN